MAVRATRSSDSLQTGEVDALPFRPESGGQRGTSEDEHGRDRHGDRVSEAVGHHRLDVCHTCRDQHAALIGESSQETADVIARKLDQMRRHYAPRTLYEELHE